MTSQNRQNPELIVLPTTRAHTSIEQLDDVLDVLDQLHTAASEGQLAHLTSADKRDLTAYLRDLIYVAEQTIQEVNTPQQGQGQPMLRVLAKPEAPNEADANQKVV